ncbi:MAG: hypothetical protein WBM93_00795 [Parasphingorhabdus sp.]
MKYFWRTLTAAAVSVAVRTVMKKLQDRSEKKQAASDETNDPMAAHLQ